MSVWFVTGATRGLGAAITGAALVAGHSVVATGRSVDRLTEGERLLPLPLDVTDPASVGAAVSAAVGRFGRIDVLINNAGRGLFGAVEETSDAETRSLFETNFFGVLAVTRAVLPVMRAQRSGHLLAVSSYGGFTQPGSGTGVYGASKFAVEGAYEALRNEVRDLGITVTLVEPGSFRTDFLEGGAGSVVQSELVDYRASMEAVRTRARSASGTQRGDPAKAAAAIVELVDSGLDVLRLPLGPDATRAIEAKLAQVAEDLERTAALSGSTDHD